MSLLLKVVKTAALAFIIDGGGAAITTGQKGHLSVPFSCTIQGARLLADQPGAIKVDIWRSIYAAFPPTNADSICGGNEPEITAGNQKDEDTTLTGWTTAINKGDILALNVDSCTTITRATLSLKVRRN